MSKQAPSPQEVLDCFRSFRDRGNRAFTEAIAKYSEGIEYTPFVWGSGYAKNTVATGEFAGQGHEIAWWYLMVQIRLNAMATDLKQQNWLSVYLRHGGMIKVPKDLPRAGDRWFNIICARLGHREGLANITLPYKC